MPRIRDLKTGIIPLLVAALSVGCFVSLEDAETRFSNRVWQKTLNIIVIFQMDKSLGDVCKLDISFGITGACM